MKIRINFAIYFILEPNLTKVQRPRDIIQFQTFAFFVCCKNAEYDFICYQQVKFEKMEHFSFHLIQVFLHFNSLDFDPPRVRGLVQGLLHDVADGLAFGQDFGQMFCAQHVP